MTLPLDSPYPHHYGFDSDPLDTRAAIRSAKRHIVAFDSAAATANHRSSYQVAAVAYAMLIAHESAQWIAKHRALDRFLDTVFRPHLRHSSMDSDSSLAPVDWYHLCTNPSNGIFFNPSPALTSPTSPTSATAMAFTNPTTNTQAGLRSDWPPNLQLVALTTAADMARALAPIDRANAAQYLHQAQAYLLAARSLFPGCGKVDRLLAVLALAVRAPAPTHHVPEPSSPPGTKARPSRTRSATSPSFSAPRAKMPLPITLWAIPSAREVDALYYLTCAECAATDPFPDDAALEKLLQPAHEWDMLGPAAQALQTCQHDGLVLAPISALLAWYCRLHSRTSLERVAELTAHLVASLSHLEPDRQYQVAIIVIGLAFRFHNVATIVPFALESLITLLCTRPPSASTSPVVWTALFSRGILACPPSALSQVSGTQLERLASHLNKLSKSADPEATAETHRWLCGLDPTLYPYPLTMSLDRAEIHHWWSQHLQECPSLPLVYDPANARTPFSAASSSSSFPSTSPATAKPDGSPPVLVLTSSAPLPPTPPGSLDSLSAASPPLYVFDTNTLLNHLSILYQPTVPLVLPLAVMYELDGLQRAAVPTVARHAHRAYTALVVSASSSSPATPPTSEEASCGAGGGVQPATATVAIYTSRGSKLTLAQVVKGVSEDYRQRGGLDNVVLDTCVALAQARTGSTAKRVVLVTEDLNLRLKAQGRKVDTCGVREVPGLAEGDKDDGGLRVGETVRFGGQQVREETKRPGGGQGRRASGKGLTQGGAKRIDDGTGGRKTRGSDASQPRRGNGQRHGGDKTRRAASGRSEDARTKRENEPGRPSWMPKSRRGESRLNLGEVSGQ